MTLFIGLQLVKLAQVFVEHIFVGKPHESSDFSVDWRETCETTETAVA